MPPSTSSRVTSCPPISTIHKDSGAAGSACILSGDRQSCNNTIMQHIYTVSQNYLSFKVAQTFVFHHQCWHLLAIKTARMFTESLAHYKWITVMQQFSKQWHSQINGDINKPVAEEKWCEWCCPLVRRQGTWISARQMVHDQEPCRSHWMTSPCVLCTHSADQSAAKTLSMLSLLGCPPQKRRSTYISHRSQKEALSWQHPATEEY